VGRPLLIDCVPRTSGSGRSSRALLAGNACRGWLMIVSPFVIRDACPGPRWMIISAPCDQKPTSTGPRCMTVDSGNQGRNPVLADPERYKELLQQNLAWMDRCMCGTHDSELPLSVVVRDLNVDRACGGPGRADSPPVVSPDAVLPSWLVMKLLEPVAWWHPEVIQRPRQESAATRPRRHLARHRPRGRVALPARDSPSVRRQVPRGPSSRP
jgi:hypothetical protein